MSKSRKSKSPETFNVTSTRKNFTPLPSLPPLPSFAADTRHVKTYIYLGHGYESSLRNDKIVPSNCTLSTIAEAGISAYVSSILNFCTISESHKLMVMNPLRHKRELLDLFLGKHYDNAHHHKIRLIQGKYHVKNEGDEYKNKHCDFLFSFNETIEGVKSIILFRSGLYEITEDWDLPKLNNRSIYDHASITINPDVGMTIENIRDLYRGSVYPHIDVILEHVERLKWIDELFSETTSELISFNVFREAVRLSAKYMLSDLMREYPGHHYFFACRNFMRVLKPENHLILDETKKLSHTENDNVALNTETLRGEYFFKRRIQEVVDELSFFQNKETRDRLIGYYDFLLREIKGKFVQFNEGMTSNMEFVNRTIIKINKGLEMHEFNQVDIDKELLVLIQESQHHGAVPYVYATNFNRTMMELCAELSNDGLYGGKCNYSIFMVMLINNFKRFIKKKGEVEEEKKILVNNTIQKINASLSSKIIKESDIDKELLSYVKECYLYGSIKYIFILNAVLNVKESLKEICAELVDGGLINSKICSSDGTILLIIKNN